MFGRASWFVFIQLIGISSNNKDFHLSGYFRFSQKARRVIAAISCRSLCG
jgi:hypothetical protein